MVPAISEECRNLLHFRTRTQPSRYSYSKRQPVSSRSTSTISLSTSMILQLALAAISEKCRFSPDYFTIGNHQ
jgi:hypothetical protein